MAKPKEQQSIPVTKVQRAGKFIPPVLASAETILSTTEKGS